MENVINFPENIITMSELKEYKNLSSEIFNNGAMFVEVDMSNPKMARLNELTPKYIALKNYCSKKIN